MKFLSAASVFLAACRVASATEVLVQFNDGSAAAQVNSGSASTRFDTTALNVPNSKSVLIGLSAEIEIFTSTTAKGDNKGGKDTATAEGSIKAEVRYTDEDSFTTAAALCADDTADVAAPGAVTFSARTQTLSVEVDLEITSTADECSTCEIEGFVEVGLDLTTTAAHHFNFFGDLSGDTYSSNNPAVFVACWTLESDSNADDGSSADAYVVLGKRMMVAQDVLAASYDSRRRLKGYEGSGTKNAPLRGLGM